MEKKQQQQQQKERYVGKFHFQTTLVDKSGYDHVALSQNSYTFLAWSGRDGISFSLQSPSAGRLVPICTTHWPRCYKLY